MLVFLKILAFLLAVFDIFLFVFIFQVMDILSLI